MKTGASRPGPCGWTSGSSACAWARSTERRGVARKLAAELIQRADQLMYDAKGRKSAHVHTTTVRVVDGRVTDITPPAAAAS